MADLTRDEPGDATDFERLLDARRQHFDVAAEHEMWIIRTLDGLAIGLQCKPCDWEWWRPGYEREWKGTV